MGKEGTWQNKNVDLKQVSEKIKKFFYANKFSEVQNFDDPGGSYIQIQAKKTGAFQSLTSQRKSIQVTIRGDANNFLIAVSEGEWGKNLTYATLFNPGVSLIGMGRNASFNKKLWNFIKDTVESLENTLVISYEELTDNPIKTKEKISTFLPLLEDIDLDLKFNAHNMHQKKQMGITNLNQESIKALSKDQINSINTILNKEQELINYFNYNIL